MPRIDEGAGAIHIKIVYHGPGLAGKTTNLQYIYNKTRPEAKGPFNAVAVKTASVRLSDGHRDICGVFSASVLSCEIIPQSMAPIRGCRPHLWLFTNAGSLYVEGIEDRVLMGADGVVFVADSQSAREVADLQSMELLATSMARQGRTLASVPLVFQYNKRDLPDVLPVAALGSGSSPTVVAPDHRDRPHCRGVQSPKNPTALRSSAGSAPRSPP